MRQDVNWSWMLWKNAMLLRIPPFLCKDWVKKKKKPLSRLIYNINAYSLSIRWILKQHTAIYPKSKSGRKGRCLNHNKVLRARKWNLTHWMHICAWFLGDGQVASKRPYYWVTWTNELLLWYPLNKLTLTVLFPMEYLTHPPSSH